MKIKRVLLFITIIAFSLGPLSCSYFRAELHTRESDLRAKESELSPRDDKEIAEIRFQRIAEALENKDKEGLKKMFSPNALEKAKDIDSGFDYLMEFYKGKIKSKKIALEVTDYKNYGERTSELKVSCTVTTDEDTYIVFFIDQLVDKKNPDNVGLYMLQIIKKSNEEKEFDWGTFKKCAGIYRPDTAK